jgi:hypothetical protein
MKFNEDNDDYKDKNDDDNNDDDDQQGDRWRLLYILHNQTHRNMTYNTNSCLNNLIILLITKSRGE